VDFSNFDIYIHMLQKDGYYEMTLWNNHTLQVWTAGRLCILRHPVGCNQDNNECRDRLIKYIHHEGILDEVLDTKIVLLDSYVEEVE